MRRPLRLWSDAKPWLMLPHNLGHLPAEDGIRVTPRRILGGKRWQIALITDMETADESGLARKKRAPKWTCGRCGYWNSREKCLNCGEVKR